MLRSILRNAGIHPRRLAASLTGAWRYTRDKSAFRAMPSAHTMPWGRELPMFTEWHETAGALGAYFHQDQTVARWIYEAHPLRHVDVGSRIDGFIGSLSVFRSVDVIDIRPLPEPVHNVAFHQLDLMKELPMEWIECTDSLSCLHTIEHFGLGRYGDALDPDGHLKGIAQLTRMIKPGGSLYLSTPIGRECIEFNAHRIFSPATLLSWFGNDWHVERSAWIDGHMSIHQTTGEDAIRTATAETGVGILHLRKSS